MLKFSALVPEATVNYVLDPSVKYGTAYWSQNGATLEQSIARARFGIYSLKVTTDGSVLNEGTYTSNSALAGISGPVTVSVYVRGEGKVRIRLYNNGASEYLSSSVTLKDDRWIRLWVTGQSSGENELRLYVELDEPTVAVRTFYVDGAQIEQKPYMTTYCDGDQPGCRWNGLYHSSTSQRSAYTRAGGRWVQLAGEEREAEDLYMTVVGGLGQAPVTNNIQSYALAPGAYFQNKKIGSRLITLTFFAKHRVDDLEQAVSLAALHQLRQLLIDVVKPDRTGGDEDIWFCYDDGDTPLYFQARYDGGLEGEWDIRNQFVNSFPLRLLAISPMLEEDSQEVQTIDIQDAFIENYVAGRINGVWSHLNYGVNDEVLAMALGPIGEIYIAGQFTVVNNNAAALFPLTAARVAYWDGTAWGAYATSTIPASAGIQCIAVAPNGDLYVGGEFTTIHGEAANRIAKFDVLSSNWEALGAGMDDVVYAVAVAPNGDVYAGGDFTTAGGVAHAKIARWDGGQWQAVGSFNGLNGRVVTIAISQDGTTLYAGGLFTAENGGGLSLAKVAQYNIETAAFAVMGSGFNNSVLSIVVSRGGVVYAGGSFTASGSATINRIARWNGNTWNAMGAGLSDETSPSLYGVSVFDNESLLVVGKFRRAGGQTGGANPANRIALWNGSSWSEYDAFPSMTGTAYGTSCVISRSQDAFIGFTSSNQLYVSGITIVNNPGTTEVRPILYMKGPGSLRWIENQTTQKRLYFNLDVQENEELTIDFARGTLSSAVRSNLAYTLLAGSDFRSFTLLPGENKIACLVVDDVGAQMTIRFTPAHWSADATQHGETF